MKKGMRGVELAEEGRREGKGLTTANTEEKCNIEEGFTRNDDLMA